MCEICGNDRCCDKYLLHPRELCKNSDRAFILLDSPSSGEIFVRLKELYAIDS